MVWKEVLLCYFPTKSEIWRNLGKLYAYGNSKMSKSLPVSNGFIHVLPRGNCPLLALIQEKPRIDYTIMSLGGQTLKRGKKYKQRKAEI